VEVRHEKGRLFFFHLSPGVIVTILPVTEIILIRLAFYRCKGYLITFSIRAHIFHSKHVLGALFSGDFVGVVEPVLVEYLPVAERFGGEAFLLAQHGKQAYVLFFVYFSFSSLFSALLSLKRFLLLYQVF